MGGKGGAPAKEAAALVLVRGRAQTLIGRHGWLGKEWNRWN